MLKWFKQLHSGWQCVIAAVVALGPAVAFLDESVTAGIGAFFLAAFVAAIVAAITHAVIAAEES